jgi:hypothetical protein
VMNTPQDVLLRLEIAPPYSISTCGVRNLHNTIWSAISTYCFDLPKEAKVTPAIEKASIRIKDVMGFIIDAKEHIQRGVDAIENDQEKVALYKMELAAHEKALVRAQGYLKTAVKKYHDSL